MYICVLKSVNKYITVLIDFFECRYLTCQFYFIKIIECGKFSIPTYIWLPVGMDLLVGKCTFVNLSVNKYITVPVGLFECTYLACQFDFINKIVVTIPVIFTYIWLPVGMDLWVVECTFLN